MFEPRGLIEIETAGRAEEAILESAIEAGAEDVEFGDGDTATVSTAPTALDAVRQALAAAGVTVASAELSRIPTTTIELDEKGAASALRLVDLIENQDDVQKVYANFHVSDEVLAKLES
jgi:transcriptional/translational regulatory protein YebC/TACO1